MVKPEAYGPITHAMGAVNVGSSVLACKFKDGVIICADTRIAYGGMHNVRDAKRIMKINDECAYSCTGEMADMQELHKMLTKK